ncbi:flagellar export protein FliJ [Desulforamulus hydrothermalis]|uniref:Flagellar FliJ protein n=1 Tax=Desulforamulus hydrothermalis Lam5 = DSM 18033 TaxID=1121428 RepID=K8EBU4_9FIRM|nr:flagellar export protein FliJ [Desulforamulus hydrothermalis]CCO09168.1 Flagellar export protein FliJ [Desulforamulus hydrothermalis Lam5 = DSM 18033]SHH11387.1 flagellar FliJ protein [Desulforamulus hydrothermalis Lam5 = DSM 18033]
MPKFHFRLEQVLQQKIKQEEQALRELAAARQDCDRWEQALKASREKLKQTMSYSAAVQNPGEQMQSMLYLEYLQQTIVTQQRHLQRAEEILQLRRRSAMQARQERLVLEKLKEKQAAEFQAWLALVEQKEIDELATLGYGRTQVK